MTKCTFVNLDSPIKVQLQVNRGRLSRDATYGTMAMLEGLWIDYMTHPDEFVREDAVQIVRRFLSAI